MVLYVEREAAETKSRHAHVCLVTVASRPE
jgi:hypothetical protein